MIVISIIRENILKLIFFFSLSFLLTPTASLAANLSNLNGLPATIQTLAIDVPKTSHLLVRSSGSPYTQKLNGIPWLVNQGGTGQVSFASSELLYGNGANALSSVATSSASCAGSVSCLPFTVVGSVSPTITSSALTSAITSLGPIGQFQSGAIQTIATSTVVYNGLSSILTVTAASNILTFAMNMDGTLAVGGGGTGLSFIDDGSLLLGSGRTGNLTTLATSTPGDILQIDFVTGRPTWVATSTLGIGSGNIGFSHPTFQTLTNTSMSIYTPPNGVTFIRIRMVGGGGGAADDAGNGEDGLATVFGSGSATTTAVFGKGSISALNACPGGLGGRGGVTLLGSQILRSGGAPGTVGITAGGQHIGGNGGNSLFGGGGFGGVAGFDTSAPPGGNASANTGSGGGGTAVNPTNTCGGGGGAGEYVEFSITSPSSMYLYQVGVGGVGSSIGIGGGNGADGIIVVEEFYH